MSEVKLKPKEEIIKEMREGFKAFGWKDVGHIEWKAYGVEIQFKDKNKQPLFMDASFILKQMSLAYDTSLMRWTEEGLEYQEGEPEEVLE